MRLSAKLVLHIDPVRIVTSNSETNVGIAVEVLDARDVRRLALARAGLLKPEWTGLRLVGRARGDRARASAHAIVERFGYLQLDTVSIAGARSHALVLMSRLEHMDPRLGEELLLPSAPLFEYWGHEACWLPLEMYPWFRFRRDEFREHPWWGGIVGENPDVARAILDRIEREGPLRSVDFDDDARGSGWWSHGTIKRVLAALWSSGELAIRQRRHFHREFDLAERVIPARLRRKRIDEDSAIRNLLLLALRGHGWATTSTLAATWRLRNRRAQIATALDELVESGDIVPVRMIVDDESKAGWASPDDLQLADRLRRVRARGDRGVLLSPFDPVLWDRARVEQLFGFEQILEIYKPKPKRVYGYYSLPILAGDRLIGRVDLKAERDQGRVRVLSKHFGSRAPGKRGTAEERAAMQSALERHARALSLDLGR